MQWMKAIAFGSWFLGWIERASRDGVITSDELAEVIGQACVTFDIKAEIQLPKQFLGPTTTDAPRVPRA